MFVKFNIYKKVKTINTYEKMGQNLRVIQKNE